MWFFIIILLFVLATIYMYEHRSPQAIYMHEMEEQENRRLAELESNKPVTTGLQSVLIVVIGLSIPGIFALAMIFNF